MFCRFSRGATYHNYARAARDIPLPSVGEPRGNSSNTFGPRCAFFTTRGHRRMLRALDRTVHPFPQTGNRLATSTCISESSRLPRFASQSLRGAAKRIPIRSHPHDFPKSKNRRRFDVSRNSPRARRDIELSPNDIEVRANDIELSHPVDFRSLSVAFRSVVATSADRTILDVTHNSSSRYGKIPRNRSAICDQKMAF